MDLPAEVLAIAQKELNEHEDTRGELLTALKEWLSKRPYLKAKQDDASLLLILRHSKFSLERSQKKLDEYYTYRTHLPDIFSNRDPFSKEIQMIFEMGLCCIFKPKTPSGRWIIYRRIHPNEASVTTVSSILMVLLMLEDVALKDNPELAIMGVDFVASGEAFGASHAMMWTPSMFKKLSKVAQECNLLRIRSIHLIDVTRTMANITEVVKSLLSEKLRNRITVHQRGFSKSNLNNLRSTLPEELGGTNGRLQVHYDYWKAKLENNKEWFSEEAQYKCNEALRPGIPKTYGDLFGMEGSFRKLSVD